MAEYKLTNKAVEDLSEKQADKYYESLISNCQKIAGNLHLGKKL